MIAIRPNVFETNSSSIHAMCMCSQEEYKQFENGVLMWHGEHLIPTDEAYANLVNYAPPKGCVLAVATV